ncbi:TrbC/VirB2 family protein [Paraburkholderia sp. A3RO-2L]|uniref:TrbC/VirB2 family protein n=1 Tax=Paraburkholderia sp. A3RO-2L TaxID=3028376 RepID=UPI003DA82DD3
MNRFSISRIAKLQIALLIGLYAYAASSFATGVTMPWDSPMCSIATALTGKAAFAIAVASFFGAGAKMVWGEELTGMTKTLLSIVMAISLLIGGASVVKMINPAAVSC